MEKISFQDPESDDTLEFFIWERAMLQGEEYLLVTEGEGAEETAYVLRKIGDEGTDQENYEFVEDEAVLKAVAPLFSELLEDTDVL